MRPTSGPALHWRLPIPSFGGARGDGDLDVHSDVYPDSLKSRAKFLAFFGSPEYQSLERGLNAQFSAGLGRLVVAMELLLRCGRSGTASSKIPLRAPRGSDLAPAPPMLAGLGSSPGKEAEKLALAVRTSGRRNSEGRRCPGKGT
jgi:hypothetical protein